MNRYIIVPIVCAFLVLFAWNSSGVPISVNHAHKPALLYFELFPNPSLAPDRTVFEYALSGAAKLKMDGKMTNSKLAIIDFSKPSTEKRLWVVDLDENKVLYHALVAHGKNSGSTFARTFSNKPQSYMSSLGFYTTGASYQGKHGLSLRLDGQEKGINDKARERAIVIHGADYVSQVFINKVGRLGRSYGCPAVSLDIHEDLIQTLGKGSCLFIWYPDKNYLSKSPILKPSV